MEMNIYFQLVDLLRKWIMCACLDVNVCIQQNIFLKNNFKFIKKEKERENSVFELCGDFNGFYIRFINHSSE